jgi:hypothetical protein
MMSNEKPNDPFGIADAVKQFTDAWNEGLEQAKRQSTCKMRRFYLMSPAGTLTRHSGVVFASGEVVTYNHDAKAVQVFPSLDIYTDTHRYSQVRWIDPEPEGWHFDPEVSK